MTSMNKIRFMCLTIAASGSLVFSATQADAQQAQTLSLSNAVATGVSTNPEYGEVAASRRATDEELRQGEALYLPSVDVRADTGVEYTDDVGTRGGLDDDDEETMWRHQEQLTITQMLFDGWSSKFEVARQEARVTSAAHRVKETAELIGLTIVEDYLEVLRQRQLLTIARQNVQEHLDILDMIQDGVTGGRSTQADMDQARARLAAARANEASTRQSLRNADAQYRRDVGDAPGQLELPAVPYESLSSDVEGEVKGALSHSPTLAIFSSDIEVAYAEAKGTRASFYPQFDLEVNGSNGNDIGGVDGRDTSASALVVMNWNLYRGGADMARSREFIHRHQQTKEARARAARDVENDVRQTWASMIAAGERAKEFAAQVDANTEVVKAYRDQFTLDRRTLLDVLDAQNELYVSRSNAINAEFLEMFAVYRLLALRGSLLPTLGVEAPRESAVASEDTWSTEEKMEAR